MNNNIEIISSKVFRRMKGKTQLFSPNDNDHYRNRLTHSLEVFAIADEIARIVEKRKVKIDFDLLETISLTYDLGHTPFSHEGERTLNSVLSGEDSLGGLLPSCLGSRETRIGFKHNIYSAKLYLRNFSYDSSSIFDSKVIDGIIKHTTPYYFDKTTVTKKPLIFDYGIG